MKKLINRKNILLIILGLIVGIFSSRLYINNVEGSNVNNNIYSIDVSQQTYDAITLLRYYIDYGIDNYCEKYQVENNYKYDIFDSRREDIEFVIVDAYIKLDVPKEMMESLANKKYFYEIQGADNVLYALVDSHRMKIFVYGGKDIELRFSEFDGQAFENNFAQEDCVEPDWTDVYQEEYASFFIEEHPHIVIPDDIGYMQNMYAEVIYITERYAKEQGVNEIFYFDAEKDIVGSVTNMVYTIRLESDARVIYADIDSRRRKYHIYEVK